MNNPIKYYVKIGEEQRGPFTLEQLQGMWRAGAVTMETNYWVEGFDEWMPLETILELLQPSPQQHRSHTSYPASTLRKPKSRGVYIILGLLFGCLGIHNFYAGYVGRGAAQLIITVLLSWTIIGLLLTVVWALVEVCTEKCDVYGDLMM